MVEPTHLKNMQPSNWIIYPIVGVNIKKNETTGHVDRTVLVPWLVGKGLFHLSYEHYLGTTT